MAEPQLALTVPRKVWDAMANDVRPTFADSYLSGARVVGERITPHTMTAYLALTANKWAMKSLVDVGLQLIKPLRYGHPDRPDFVR